jgi:zinc transport system ATP-binding protein
MNHTLEVYKGTSVVFYSDGHWLYPLFELEQFLHGAEENPADLVVHDKIVGRAAALLMVYLGLGRVHARLISRLGREALDFHGVPHTYDELVERILCQTEHLLESELDPVSAYALLRERADL